MGGAQSGQRLIAGAMSGTSADGVDVAIVAVAGRGTDMTARLVLHRHRPHPDLLRSVICTVRSGGSVVLDTLARLTGEVSDEYGAAVNEALADANVEPPDLAAVATHGQTMCHAPPVTMQILDPALVAARTACTVVSDFRRADCAAGGQGAPLVPFADYILFRSAETDRLVVNIGGIANVTCLFR